MDVRKLRLREKYYEAFLTGLQRAVDKLAKGTECDMAVFVHEECVRIKTRRREAVMATRAKYDSR